MIYCSEAMVAKLKINRFFGLGFMKAHRCSVDIGNEVLLMAERKTLSIVRFLGYIRIANAETVSIPPRSERIVHGKVFVTEGSKLPVGEGII